MSAAASPYVVHTATSSGEMSFGGLGDAQMVSGMYAKAVGGYLIVVIMGVLAMAGFQDNETGYQAIQGTKPQTLAYGLTDSPAGLAAWIAEKFHVWTDHTGNFGIH